MKKLLKNKKGFTLVELLAVIVVLAIIMVIATQQINKTIQKSRADSFVSSYKMVLDAVKKCELQSMTDADCKSSVDLSVNDYDLNITRGADGTYAITLEDKPGGKFVNMDLTAYYEPSAGTDASKENLTGATTVEKTKITASYKVD